MDSNVQPKLVFGPQTCNFSKNWVTFCHKLRKNGSNITNSLIFYFNLGHAKIFLDRNLGPFLCTGKTPKNSRNTQKVKNKFPLCAIKMKIIAFLNELLKHSRETLELPTYLLLGNDKNRTEKMTMKFFEKRGFTKVVRQRAVSQTISCSWTTFELTTLKKHSCHNGLKLLPAQFFMLFGQDFWALIAWKPLFLHLELKKSCLNSTKNGAGSNFKPLWQECFFREIIKMKRDISNIFRWKSVEAKIRTKFFFIKQRNYTKWSKLTAIFPFLHSNLIYKWNNRVRLSYPIFWGVFNRF